MIKDCRQVGICIVKLGNIIDFKRGDIAAILRGFSCRTETGEASDRFGIANRHNRETL